MATLPTVLITAALAVASVPPAAAPGGPYSHAAASPPSGFARDSDAPPAPAQTMAVYRTVEPWVRALEVPAAAPAGVPAVTGAAVILRSSGRIVGRGIAISQTPDPAAIWLASRDAIAEARRRLPAASDLVAEEALRQTAGAITISLELAGPLTPILPEPSVWTDLEVMLNPGIDGVAARIGEGPDAPIRAMFPSQMLPTNTMPHQGLGAAVSQVTGDARLGLAEPGVLRTEHGVAMFRFRTTHLAQAALAAEPRFLHRGHRTVAQGELNSAGLRDMADSLFRHIVATAGADRPESAESPARADRLLARAAVGAYAAAARPHTFEDLAGFTLDAEGPGHAPDGQIDRAVETALTIVAWSRSDEAGRAGGPIPLPPDAAAMRETLLRVFSPDDGFDKGLPAPARGIIALALVNIARSEHSAGTPLAGPIPTADLASEAVRRCFRETPEAQLVSQMPWLGWAELRLADLKARAAQPTVGSPPPAPEIPSAVALRRMREQVWRHMLIESDCGPDNQDLVGGIVFSKTKVPLPTWQSARPLAFIATMLGDPRLTEPHEFNTELVRLLAALRFLRQLQVDDATLWMFPDRERDRGGIRAAAWDQRMPTDASAMTLLAVCETLKSLEVRAKMQAAQPPAGQGQSSASPK